METSDPPLVSVTTPSGTKKMALTPFSTSSSTASKPPAESRPNKRKADVISSPSESWVKNLERRGGFWGDAYWYDLHLERRLPQAKSMLSELVLALPPCGDLKVLDLCAGSGRASAAVLEAYPSVQLILIDSSNQRLNMAEKRLEQLQPGVTHRTQFLTKVVTTEIELLDETVDVVVACLAFHVLSEKPSHYQIQEEQVSAEEIYEKLFRATWRALNPGGHVVFADHVGQMPLFQQLKLLEKAGFEDVDCAWRQEDSFVAGGRKPQS
ncbi:hypothetical protein PHMEG_00010135 [Phytophthora megakarya]|uniref:Methyltransferase domain-containing protein n=1 Tax=Phytophthora megakarya TaxID=4795 RepID=A0A225WFD6_9STRA|nr:hypothetical protein PHMEG_00010135 [Phytophthora megakarya]